MSMGERIKMLRISKGYTQQTLGEELGVKKAAVQKYENGTIQNLKKSTLEKMAEVLDVSPAYIFGWEELDDTKEDIFYIDEGDTFMSKYPPEAREELQTFLDYLDHRYGIKK